MINMSDINLNIRSQVGSSQASATQGPTYKHPTNQTLLQCRLFKVHQRIHLMHQLQCPALGILRLHSDLLLCLCDRATPELIELFTQEQNLRVPSWGDHPASRTTKRSFAIGSGRNQMFSEAFITAVSKVLSCEKLMSMLMAMIVDNRAESISGYVYSRS